MTADAKKAIRWKLGMAGAAIVALGLSAPFLFKALEAGIALGILVVGVIVANAFIPWFSMKMANLGVKAVVHEATVNPIETLTNIAIAKDGEINAKDQELADFDAMLKTFKRQTNDHKKRFAAADVTDKLTIIGQGEEFVVEGRGEIVLARQTLANFQENIAMTESELQLAISMGRITDRMLANNGGDVLTKLKAHAALESAHRQMDQGLAKLSLVMSRRPNFADMGVALPAPQANVIDIQAVVVNERATVPVKRGE